MKTIGQALTRTESVTVTDAAPKQPQPENTGDGQATYADSFVRRRKVSVKGTGGVAATVVVTVERGYVWVSIHPLFTWEDIMEPGKVDELMNALGLAREDAKKMTSGSISPSWQRPRG